MKTILGILTVAILFIGSTSAQTTLTLNNENSNLTWVGRKVVGEHSGTIDLLKGFLILNKKNITSGEINVDMNSLKNTDMQGEWSDKLVVHLKSDDFFGTDKFPIATFNIERITPKSADNYVASGSLTIKGITNPISFPVQIFNTKSNLQVKGTANVDRTLYGVKYGSSSFFDSLGDKAIENLFELSFDINIKTK
tara:strand:- start:144 stop:728 length:585 start_codon:yes stop_codon:yes gene_type:complete